MPYTAIPTTDAQQPNDSYILRVCVGPISEDDTAEWTRLLERQPAVAWARLASYADGVAHYTLGALSRSRLHVQLIHVAARMDARFTPTAEGELSIMLREPVKARDTRRTYPGVIPRRTRGAGVRCRCP